MLASITSFHAAGATFTAQQPIVHSSAGSPQPGKVPASRLDDFQQVHTNAQAKFGERLPRSAESLLLDRKTLIKNLEDCVESVIRIHKKKTCTADFDLLKHYQELAEKLIECEYAYNDAMNYGKIIQVNDMDFYVILKIPPMALPIDKRFKRLCSQVNTVVRFALAARREILSTYSQRSQDGAQYMFAPM